MIDAHVHLFPDATLGREWQALVGYDPVRPGTPEDYRERMAGADVERAILLLFPRSAQRARALREAAGETAHEAAIRTQVAGELSALNDWGCALARRDPRFIAFVGVNPRFQSPDELVAEIRRGVVGGSRGVKIIPPAMELYPDDPALEPVHATCAELGLPILSQSGTGGAAPPGQRGPYGRPAAWGPVLAAFPGLRVILAHLGRGCEDELVALADRYETVWSDTSLRLGGPGGTGNPGDGDRLGEDGRRGAGGFDGTAVRDLIRRLGVERVLLGSNYPIGDPVASRTALERLGLGSRETDLVAGGNAARLLASTGELSPARPATGGSTAAAPS